MSEEPVPVKYYAIIDQHGPDDPGGLIRRTFTPEGRLDEAVQLDFTWRRSSALYEWEHGELMFDFVELSEDEAMVLIERFRAKWSAKA